MISGARSSQCPFCEGDGKCSACNGTGHNPERSNPESQCQRCTGTGTCAQCLGAGVIREPASDESSLKKEEIEEVTR